MQRNKYQSVYTRGFTHSKSSLNNSQAVENSSRITCVNRVVFFCTWICVSSDCKIQL